MSGSAYDVWGAIAGAIGVFGVFPIATKWVRSHLPSSLLRGLEADIAATEQQLMSCLKEGVLPSGPYLYHFYVALWALKFHLDELRETIYGLKTWKEDVAKWYGGLSDSISVLRGEVKEMRAQIAKLSGGERKKLVERGSHTPFAWPLSVGGEQHWNLPPPASADAGPIAAILERLREGKGIMDDWDAILPSSETETTSGHVPFVDVYPTDSPSGASNAQTPLGSLISLENPNANNPELPPKALRGQSRARAQSLHRRASQQELLKQYGMQLCGANPASERNAVTVPLQAIA